MDLRAIKKKFRQEVLLDTDGGHNSQCLIVKRFLFLCAKVFAGLLLSIFLGPLSLVRPIEIWLMKLGPDKASHFINGMEMHLRRAQIEDVKNSIKIVIWPQKFPNEALAKMYRRIVYIVGPKQRLFAKILPFVIWKRKVFKYSVNSADPRLLKVLDQGSTSIKFSDAEIMAGKRLTTTLLGEIDCSFVIFSYTSSEYRTQVDKNFHPLENLNEKIPTPEAFESTVLRLTQSGVKVVRQGLFLDDSPALERAGLIVPNCPVPISGFSEVWLTSRCKFLLTAHTGAYFFAEAFNKPWVMTDAHTFAFPTWSSRGLLIFCLCWNEVEKKFASFQWMKDNPRWCYDSEKVGKVWKIIPNTPKQINDVVCEKLARLNGEWVESYEDEELQKRWQRFVFGAVDDFEFLPRIGAKFLREHQHLLPD
jgi:putative glycosyltransferase (TIGR04372 family)